MLTILLLGELGKRFGRSHSLAVKSPAEAVRALSANFPDFTAHVASSADRNVGYRVIAGDQSVSLDQLHHPASRRVIIAPVIMGASGNAFGKILIGGALILASLYVPGLAQVTLFGQTTLATVAFGIGVSLALGGVAQLLAPNPSGEKPQEQTPASYIFDGPVNVTAQGNPVPVGYGRMMVGSAVISAGLTVDDISIIEQQPADPAAFYDPNEAALSGGV
jgi:predicted phage tail protein